MKQVLVLILIVVSYCSYGQCTECKTLAEALKQPKNVKTVSHNGSIGTKLNSLPSTIGELENVEILYLSDHDIKTIPKEIGNLKKLKELSFAGCKLQKLPEEIFTLTNLKELILMDNLFTEAYKKEIKARFLKLMPKTAVLL